MRMMKRIRDASIRTKLICYSYMIITPILLVISACLFASNYQKSASAEREVYQKNVENLSDSIDTMLGSIIEFGTYISINNDILAILSSEKQAALNADSQLWVHNAPMRTLQDMVSLNGQIKTLAIYPENGVKPYLRCTDATAYVSDIEAIRETTCYQTAVSKRGKISFGRVSKDGGEIYQANRTDKIVLYREIYDRAKQKRLGYLVIGALAEKYIQLCENSLPADAAGIVVVNEDGNVLIQAGNVEDLLLSEILEGGQPGSRSEDAEYVLYSHTSEQTGVTVYEMVPRDGIRNNLWEIAKMPLALLFGFLIGLYPILIFVSNIVSKPLKELCQAMSAFKQGDFEQKVKVNTADEVGEVAACFNQMVEDIRELIDTNYVMALREKESELNVLQAQINPHFLYNTLDSLYWRAVNEGNEEIGEDILALSNLFRMVLGQGSGIISIANEKTLIEEYLHIQKMRFSENLNYGIQMEDEILEKQIPKLILQPFVENAVVHGFERGGESCLIMVEGKRDGDWLLFTIKDNGVGMSREQIEGIWEVPDTKRYAGQRIGRYAIKNVRERLALKYHDEFELEIESAKGIGTCVTIRIPWEE